MIPFPGISPKSLLLGAGVEDFLATPTSANLKTAVTDETGSGALVFATSPTLVTPILGTPASGTLTNCTGLPIVGGTTGTLSIARGGTGATSLASGYIPYSSGGTAYTASPLSTDGTHVTNSGRLLFDTSQTPTTPAAGTGAITYNSTNGMVFAGNGTANDLIFTNSLGQSIIQNPHATTDMVLGGTLRQLNTTFTSASGDSRISYSETVGLTLRSAGSAGSVLITTSTGATLIYALNGGLVGVGVTPTAMLHVAASTTTRASLRIPSGTAPTTPNSGDIWNASNVLKFYNGTSTFSLALNASITSGYVPYHDGTSLFQSPIYTDGTNVGTGGITSPTAAMHLPTSTTARASLRIPAGTAPTSPNEGDVWNDSTRKAISSYIGNMTGYDTRVIFTNTADKSVSSSITETSMFGTGIGTTTLAANSLSAGKLVEVVIRGYLGSNNSSAGTFNVRFKIAGTTELATGAFTLPDGIGFGVTYEGLFELRCYVQVLTSGASGTARVWGVFTFHESSGVRHEYAMAEANNVGVSIDTTASQALDVTGQFGTSSGFNFFYANSQQIRLAA